MPVSKENPPFSYDVYRGGDEIILRIDCEAYPLSPSIEDDPICMSHTLTILIEVKEATKIILVQKREYEYDEGQTKILREIAKIYDYIIKQKLVTYYSVSGAANANARYNKLQELVFNTLKNDPIAAYVELKREARDEKINLEQTGENNTKYLVLLNHITKLLEDTKLVKLAKLKMKDYREGDREIYRTIFFPTIKPDFMFTKLMADYPVDGEEIDSYNIENTEVTIFKMPETVLSLYHVLPPEFKISEDKYEILDLARKILAEHKPKKEEFTDPQRMRSVFYNVGYDLIGELADSKGIKLKEKEVEELAQILIRYTIGFGLIEILLEDERVQDITINSPMGKTPIFIVHQDFGDCTTNIIPTENEAESWASKLRMISGRPLDEANPILDTELTTPKARARVAVVAPPLNPFGLAYSMRRHRDEPWTFPLYIKNKMMNPLAAGLLSFLIDGARTFLVAGTRSAGKTSLLGSMLVDLMRRYRVITIEDTLELPTGALRDMGYNIQSMKVAAALTKGTSEVPADEGIRTTLRMGDSALIIGEIRSKEALALYEAMRIGAMANIVAGTIHADSPYGTYDRVVNDLGVPKTSFKATDIIVVTNPIRSSDGLHRWRRITQITEVRKFWKDDPLAEGGFVDLMKYNPKKDQLEVSDDLKNGDSDVLKSIAGNVKDWAGNWDAVWDNIVLRAKTKEEIVNASDRAKLPELLEAPFVIRANDEFHRISESVKEELGTLNSKKIFFEWNEWLKKEVKTRLMQKE